MAEQPPHLQGGVAVIDREGEGPGIPRLPLPNRIIRAAYGATAALAGQHLVELGRCDAVLPHDLPVTVALCRFTGCGAFP